MGNYRPVATRKSKRNRTDDNVDATSDILSKILSNGQVNEEDLDQLYMISKPVCQGCRVNTKDNPNCLCGLIPVSNGTRKTGLWQKTSEIIQALGPDPSTDLRASPSSPAGLTNLGATCYANSILQFLYMNKPFREGVFSVEPELLKEEPVLNQLARLFAQLHSSKMAYVESAPFIQTLELDNSIQQDSHEFLTLLYCLLERCLSRSKVSKAKTIVQDLFRGGVSHVTTCSECGIESQASYNVEDFYELELNVKGLKSLDESLDDYFSIEELTGDNQYSCGSCSTRVNASRSIKLRSLPAVLTFQLKRYVFLPNTTTKKKITSSFSFPGTVDMSSRLSESSGSNLIYDLSAVLVHKGAGANSGHYVANIKDENTGLWWEFDDESVSSLGNEPFGSSKAVANNKSVDEPEGNGFHTEGESLDVKPFTSNDAYMLMYVMRGTNNVTEDKRDEPLPDHLSSELEEFNVTYVANCEEYKTKKEGQLSQITERRQEVRSILSEAPVQMLGDNYFWISSDWLRHWADTINPLHIDNTSLECKHGNVSVSKVNCMKRISTEAWTKLQSKYEGGPALGKALNCKECVIEMASNNAICDSYRDQRVLMKEVAEAALTGKNLQGELFYVSRTWLNQWVKRKYVDAPCEADAGPTASIRCTHGELAAGEKLVLVPETLWNFFVRIAKTVKPDDSIGCTPFPSEVEPCAQCCIELNEVACVEDNLKEFRMRQKQSHEKLALGKSVGLNPDMIHYLVPSSWISTWRSFTNVLGKNPVCVEPEKLDEAVKSLICEKHGRLNERPPILVWRRGVIQQKSPTTDVLTVLPEEEWRLFCEDWGGIEGKGVSAGIEIDTTTLNNCIDIDEVITDDLMDEPQESKNPLLVNISPEVCEECIGERESCELMKKMAYSNKDICVCFVRGKGPPKSVLEASSGNGTEPNRRSSKRSKKTTYGNSVNLNVSGTTTLYQLKMMIWESFDIVKENQTLHKGPVVIEGESESVSLADLNIFAGDVLWVTDSKVHEDRDIAEELVDTKMENAPRTAEAGFRGSLLTSSSSVVSSHEEPPLV